MSRSSEHEYEPTHRIFLHPWDFLCKVPLVSSVRKRHFCAPITIYGMRDNSHIGIISRIFHSPQAYTRKTFPRNNFVQKGRSPFHSAQFKHHCVLMNRYIEWSGLISRLYYASLFRGLWVSRTDRGTNTTHIIL